MLHVYFTGDGDPRVIGSFQVVGPNKHANAARFGKGVTGTKLFEIVDPAFETKLRRMRGNDGYQPDPVLKKMTGWILVHRPDVATPAYLKAPFTNQTTLVRQR